jgi:hypothetical protein
VAADLATYGFEDLLLQFRQRHGYHHGHTWKQHRDGTMVCSCCDYIRAWIGACSRMCASKIRAASPRTTFWSLVCCRPRPPMITGGTCSPLWAPQWGPQMHADALFQSLMEAIPPPVCASKCVWRSWISDGTWKMVDEHSALRRRPNHDRAEARRPDQQIQHALQANRTW